mgnify:CR=1 FL=1
MKAKKKSNRLTNISSANKSRRNFIKHTAMGAIGFSIIPREVLGKGFIAPSDRINLGVIGLGKQINGLSSNFIKGKGSQIIACSDVWSTKRIWYKEMVEKAYAKQKNKDQYQAIDMSPDYRELLRQSDIDAVIIATPDHWHGIQGVDAMNAGKDVYCEKPLTHTIAEGIDMVATAEKTAKILQTGSMQRSWGNFRKACELVRNGYLGQINKVLVNVGDPAVPYDLQAETIPAEINWDHWCGPAPLLNYNHRLAPSKNNVDFWPDWRLYREVGGGILADWGAHMFDIAQWGLGMDHSGPVTFNPPKGRNAKRGMQMFYANGVEMVHEDFGRGWGVRFIGSKGTIDISRDYFESNPKELMKIKDEDISMPLYRVKKDHYQDWLDSIKSREQPICNVEIGHRSATVCNIANIGYQLGRSLTWDPIEQHLSLIHISEPTRR